MSKARSFGREVDGYRDQVILSLSLSLSTLLTSVAVELQHLMIIKGLFRRYERWNPVHPTVGTFWGMGIGIGCGVGWGPGFGPEVIGYVGAGCGVGFSVGITLAGIGVGLPTNGLVQIPLNVFVTSSSGALELARVNALSTMKSVAGDSWNYVSPYVTSLKKGTCERLQCFKTNVPLVQQVELTQLNKIVTIHMQSMLECMEAFKDRLRPTGKGS